MENKVHKDDHPAHQGKMVDPDNPQSCLRWIKDEELVHRSEGFGENKKAVSDALSDQYERNQIVQNFDKTVNKVKKDEEEVRGAYGGLKVVSGKRLGCLENVSQIAGLEDLLGALSVEFASRASTLVKDGCGKGHDEGSEHSADGVPAAAQNCVLAVRSNWGWISKLVKCTDIHLQHSSEYHEFFHEIQEYKDWMPVELRAAQDKVNLSAESCGDSEEAKQFLLDVKELLVMFLHWQGKLDRLFERSKKIIPVPLRTHKCEYFRPVSSLCDYRTKDINIREGEELLLTDNSETQSWKVRTLNAVEADVPSVILLIPGPDPDAVQAALTLRFQLLTIWTLNVKRVGKSLIIFLIMVLRDFTDDEKKLLRAMPDAQKNAVRKSLDDMMNKLGTNWQGFAGFSELQTRVDSIKQLLDQKGNLSDQDEEQTGLFVNKLETSEEVLGRFNDLWRQWDTYRIIMESSKHPDYMLINQNLDQLQYLTIEELRRMWQQGLFFNDGDCADFESWLKKMRMQWETQGTMGFGSSERISASGSSMLGSSVVDGGMNGYGMNGNSSSSGYGERSYSEGIQSEEMIECESVGSLSAMANGSSQANASSTLERNYETAQTDQFTSCEQEEKKTFVITGVVDPRNGEEVSMQQAVMLGIINSTEGTYVDPNTGISIPIPVAMSQGHIKVEFTTTKKSAEKRHDVGLITIKTHRESRPYTVKFVVDAKTDEKYTVDDAIKRGLLDQQNNIYHNTINDTEMSLGDALDSGLLIVEFDKEAEMHEPEIVTKTYAIHSVVNQKLKAKVGFADAVRQNLLDKETGAYYHNVDNESIYVGDAIKKGFIKATIVRDPNSLDIDPENKMVIEKVQSIRKKLLNPLRAMTALKKAAESGRRGEGLEQTCSNKSGDEDGDEEDLDEDDDGRTSPSQDTYITYLKVTPEVRQTLPAYSDATTASDDADLRLMRSLASAVRGLSSEVAVLTDGLRRSPPLHHTADTNIPDSHPTVTDEQDNSEGAQTVPKSIHKVCDRSEDSIQESDMGNKQSKRSKASGQEGEVVCDVNMDEVPEGQFSSQDTEALKYVIRDSRGWAIIDDPAEQYGGDGQADGHGKSIEQRIDKEANNGSDDEDIQGVNKPGDSGTDVSGRGSVNPRQSENSIKQQSGAGAEVLTWEEGDPSRPRASMIETTELLRKPPDNQLNTSKVEIPDGRSKKQTESGSDGHGWPTSEHDGTISGKDEKKLLSDTESSVVITSDDKIYEGENDTDSQSGDSIIKSAHSTTVGTAGIMATSDSADEELAKPSSVHLRTDVVTEHDEYFIRVDGTRPSITRPLSQTSDTSQPSSSPVVSTDPAGVRNDAQDGISDDASRNVVGGDGDSVFDSIVPGSYSPFNSEGEHVDFDDADSPGRISDTTTVGTPSTQYQTTVDHTVLTAHGEKDVPLTASTSGSDVGHVSSLAMGTVGDSEKGLQSPISPTPTEREEGLLQTSPTSINDKDGEKFSLPSLDRGDEEDILIPRVGAITGDEGDPQFLVTEEGDEKRPFSSIGKENEEGSPYPKDSITDDEGPADEATGKVDLSTLDISEDGSLQAGDPCDEKAPLSHAFSDTDKKEDVDAVSSTISKMGDTTERNDEGQISVAPSTDRADVELSLPTTGREEGHDFLTSEGRATDKDKGVLATDKGDEKRPFSSIGKENEEGSPHPKDSITDEDVKEEPSSFTITVTDKDDESNLIFPPDESKSDEGVEAQKGPAGGATGKVDLSTLDISEDGSLQAGHPCDEKALLSHALSDTDKKEHVDVVSSTISEMGEDGKDDIFSSSGDTTERNDEGQISVAPSTDRADVEISLPTTGREEGHDFLTPECAATDKDKEFLATDKGDEKRPFSFIGKENEEGSPHPKDSITDDDVEEEPSSFTIAVTDKDDESNLIFPPDESKSDEGVEAQKGPADEATGKVDLSNLDISEDGSLQAGHPDDEKAPLSHAHSDKKENVDVVSSTISKMGEDGKENIVSSSGNTTERNDEGQISVAPSTDRADVKLSLPTTGREEGHGFLTPEGAATDKDKEVLLSPSTNRAGEVHLPFADEKDKKEQSVHKDSSSTLGIVETDEKTCVSSIGSETEGNIEDYPNISAAKVTDKDSGTSEQPSTGECDQDDALLPSFLASDRERKYSQSSATNRDGDKNLMASNKSDSEGDEQDPLQYRESTIDRSGKMDVSITERQTDEVSESDTYSVTIEGGEKTLDTASEEGSKGISRSSMVSSADGDGQDTENTDGQDRALSAMTSTGRDGKSIVLSHSSSYTTTRGEADDDLSPVQADDGVEIDDRLSSGVVVTERDDQDECVKPAVSQADNVGEKVDSASTDIATKKHGIGRHAPSPPRASENISDANDISQDQVKHSDPVHKESQDDPYLGTREPEYTGIDTNAIERADDLIQGYEGEFGAAGTRFPRDQHLMIQNRSTYHLAEESPDTSFFAEGDRPLGENLPSVLILPTDIRGSQDTGAYEVSHDEQDIIGVEHREGRSTAEDESAPTGSTEDQEEEWLLDRLPYRPPRQMTRHSDMQGKYGRGSGMKDDSDETSGLTERDESIYSLLTSGEELTVRPRHKPTGELMEEDLEKQRQYEELQRRIGQMEGESEGMNHSEYDKEKGNKHHSLGDSNGENLAETHIKTVISEDIKSRDGFHDAETGAYTDSASASDQKSDSLPFSDTSEMYKSSDPAAKLSEETLTSWVKPQDESLLFMFETNGEPYTTNSKLEKSTTIGESLTATREGSDQSSTRYKSSDLIAIGSGLGEKNGVSPPTKEAKGDLSGMSSELCAVSKTITHSSVSSQNVWSDARDVLSPGSKRKSHLSKHLLEQTSTPVKADKVEHDKISSLGDDFDGTKAKTYLKGGRSGEASSETPKRRLTKMSHSACQTEQSLDMADAGSQTDILNTMSSMAVSYRPGVPVFEVTADGRDASDGLYVTSPLAGAAQFGPPGSSISAADTDADAVTIGSQTGSKRERIMRAIIREGTEYTEVGTKTTIQRPKDGKAWFQSVVGEEGELENTADEETEEDDELDELFYMAPLPSTSRVLLTQGTQTLPEDGHAPVSVSDSSSALLKSIKKNASTEMDPQLSGSIPSIGWESQSGIKHGDVSESSLHMKGLGMHSSTSMEWATGLLGYFHYDTMLGRPSRASQTDVVFGGYSEDTQAWSFREYGTYSSGYTSLGHSESGSGMLEGEGEAYTLSSRDGESHTVNTESLSGDRASNISHSEELARLRESTSVEKESEISCMVIVSASMCSRASQTRHSGPLNIFSQSSDASREMLARERLLLLHTESSSRMVGGRSAVDGSSVGRGGRYAASGSGALARANSDDQALLDSRSIDSGRRSTADGAELAARRLQGHEIGVPTSTATSTRARLKARERARQQALLAAAGYQEDKWAHVMTLTPEGPAVRIASADSEFDEFTHIMATTAERALISRMCKCCIPMQVLMLLLLGIACLVPMADDELGCLLANRFENSLEVMLHHDGGPPT